MKTVYIEKTKVEKNDINEIYPMNKVWKRDATFTIGGEDLHFLTVQFDIGDKELKEIYRDIHTHTGAIVMISDITHHTNINGVVRKGNYILYEGDEYMLETEVKDARCDISFPLVTQRKESNNITFTPLNLKLPTELDKISRRIDSNCILEDIEDKQGYTNKIILKVALATNIYPEQLIWRYSEIPPEITRLLSNLKDNGSIPENLSPAYKVMTEEEQSYLDLDLYIGNLTSPIDIHMKPIDAVKKLANRSEIEQRTNLEGNILDLDDLGQVIKDAKLLANRIIEGDNKVNVERRNGNVYISMKKK